MLHGFYHPLCPLCLTDVVESQADSYYVLPIDLVLAADLVDKTPSWQLNPACIHVANLRISRCQSYPSVPYGKRCLLLHHSCREIAGAPLSALQLRLLIELVEPTFVQRFMPPATTHGAFSCSSDSGSSTDNLLLPLIDRLPRELWHMVLTYDIARLLFVMKTAAQLPPTVTIQSRVPDPPLCRFTREELLLRPGRKLGIYLGRLEIERMSNPCRRRITPTTTTTTTTKKRPRC